MSNGISIREAREDEYPLIEDLMVDSFAKTGLYVSDAYERDIRTLHRHAARWIIWTAVDETDDSIIGAVLTPRTALEEPRLLTHSLPGERMFRFLSVASRAQGHGVGRTLVLHSIQAIGGLGIRTVGIFTGFPLTHAVHLYESLGFIRRPEQELYLHEGHRLLKYTFDIPERLVQPDSAVDALERRRQEQWPLETPGSWPGCFRELRAALPQLVLLTDKEEVRNFCDQIDFNLGHEVPLGAAVVNTSHEDNVLREIAERYHVPVFATNGDRSFLRQDDYQTGIVIEYGPEFSCA